MSFSDMVVGEKSPTNCDAHLAESIFQTRSSEGKVISEMYSFEWYPGFAVSQKQKSIKSLHNAIIKADVNAKPLEISTKSTEATGIRLSDLKQEEPTHATQTIHSTERLPHYNTMD